MKQVILFRHAKSSWGDDNLDDHERPLSSRGLRDAPRMGERLAAHGVKPDLLLVSSATRARQTADLMKPAIAHESLHQIIEPSLYLASPGQILEILSRINDEHDVVVSIGHNPGLTQLANMMLPGLGLDNLPTAGVVAINCEADNWRTLDQASFDLEFYDAPKMSFSD